MTLSINDLTSGPDDPPKVEVLVTGLGPEVATVTAYRVSGGFEEEVGGIVGVRVAGAGTWVDFEVPAQRATYRLRKFDDLGVDLGFTESVSIELGYDGCWMHNPGAPTAAVRVKLLSTAGQSLSRPVPGEVVYPRGRRVGVMIAEPRRGLSGAVFDVMTTTFQEADKLQSMLGSPLSTAVPVVCIRLGVDYAGFRVQSPLYLGVLDIAEEGHDVRRGGQSVIQRISGDEAARPAPGLFIPLLRRMDVNAFYASRADFDSAYLTRLAANRDYSLAGYAG